MPLRNFIVIALTCLVSWACYSSATKNRYANLFAEAMNLVETEALFEVPRKQLFESAMDGMMGQLDEHSAYVSSDMFRSIDEDMNQQFGGVGMYVDEDPTNQKLIVLAPIPETPAFRAGVQAGDEIVEIAGKSTQSMKRADAIKLMRGVQGTEVEVVFRREERLLPKSLVREAIPVPSVHGDWRNASGTWRYVLEDMPNVGYIRLLQFGKKSADEIRAALVEIEDSVDGVILDLRNNTGGLLNSATEICDLFIDKGLPIVRTRGRGKKLVDEHFSLGRPEFNMSKPLVILVNRHSASASEIVAGCLQDHKRAVVIGEQTWGKGTVQNLIPMQFNQSALKLTVASFWRPSDRNIDRSDPEAKKTKVWGIQPNEGFDITMSLEEVFENLRNRNRRDLKGLQTNGSKEPPVESQAPQPESSTVPESAPALESDVDRPLERAKEYFRTLFKNVVAA